MTWHIVASNGKESRVVTFSALGGVDKTMFGDEESAEIHAAVLAARNPGWEFEVWNVRREPNQRSGGDAGIGPVDRGD